MNVSIERSGCIGCGMCELICPEVLSMADDGLAEVYKQPDEAAEEKAKQAAADCPVNVISY